MSSGDRRIVVEVVTPEVVDRLEADIAALRGEIKQLNDRHEKLHKTVYKLMEAVADMKRNKGKS